MTQQEKMSTICRNCKHFDNHGPNRGKSEDELIWYNLYCTASENKKTTCPVTGELTWENGQQFEHCRSINSGNCPMFEAIK